jgi:DNA polymerase-3 subunit gamma/tau
VVSVDSLKESYEESKPKPQLKRAAFGKGKLVSSFSLKKKEEEAEAEEEEEDLTNKPRTPFTQEQLDAKWKSYCYIVQKNKKASLYATLTKHPVKLEDDWKLSLVLDSEIQELELNTEKSNLLGFLRRELNNYGIDLITEVVQHQQESKHLTSKDKFLKMAEKNPVLAELRERLGLDIEY